MGAMIEGYHRSEGEAALAEIPVTLVK